MKKILDFNNNGLMKIIFDNKDICASTSTIVKNKSIGSLSYQYSQMIAYERYINFFKNSTSLLFINDSIKDDHIKIFLGNGHAYSINSDKWSMEIHINKIENFLKLKCFL